MPFRPVHGHHQWLARRRSVLVDGARCDTAFAETADEAVAFVLAAGEHGDVLGLDTVLVNHSLTFAATAVQFGGLSQHMGSVPAQGRCARTGSHWSTLRPVRDRVYSAPESTPTAKWRFCAVVR